jgi:pimeloyl-ACP methyl ester carboxylesterase
MRAAEMSTEQPANAPSRSGCAWLLGLALLAVGGALFFAWLATGLSLWTAALAVGLVLLALGALTRSSRRGGLLGAGALLVLGPWLLRVALVRGSEQTRLTTLPADSGARLLSRLYPEPDGALAMAKLLGATGGLHDPEVGRFDEILKQAYARANPSSDMQPTPAIATYLGLETPQAFDTLIIRPPKQRVEPDAALVFLHGYAGNFYVYCWEIAQAAAAANLLTLCPSTGPSGTWWDERGDQTLKATLDYAHEIGMNRIYLGGLSNGAAGASVLSLKYQQRLAGLVLVSGTRAETPPPLPVLVLQGSADQMMPATYARAYAKRGGANVKYREVNGSHFILLSQAQTVRPMIADFLATLEKSGTAPLKKR